LILDCMIERGNPADSAMFLPLLDRQQGFYRKPPRQVAADGGFASQDNLREAKEKGIGDVSFSKRRGISVLEMVRSGWVYKKLKNFRAGIEIGDAMEPVGNTVGKNLHSKQIRAKIIT
jgi:transposase, IS5 family